MSRARESVLNQSIENLHKRIDELEIENEDLKAKLKNCKDESVALRLELTEYKRGLPPFSFTVKGAAAHFGLTESSIRSLIDGKICRGTHYLKMGRRILIIRQQFIKYLIETDGILPYSKHNPLVQKISRPSSYTRNRKLY